MLPLILLLLFSKYSPHCYGSVSVDQDIKSCLSVCFGKSGSVQVEGITVLVESDLEALEFLDGQHNQRSLGLCLCVNSLQPTEAEGCYHYPRVSVPSSHTTAYKYELTACPSSLYSNA